MPVSLLTIKNAAVQLGVHPETLRRAIRNGRLACYRLGGLVRLSQEQLDEYLARSFCPARGSSPPGEFETNADDAVRIVAFQQRASRALDT